ncbi:hypothetical protein [Phenylobacterium aquaticum]|uniref:hypothetical protein n=1 Tax=Phenylobacterium aquaticum TaxID=1763816 RepID=UPI0026EAD635|nr:hypothetical protein [Phenylobacterium aquaticum]
MRPVILRLDDALDAQSDFARAVEGLGGRRLEARDLGPAMRLWSPAARLGDLRDRLGQDLPATERADLVFAGSGDFHHVSPLLIARAIAAAGGPVTVIHFDNHPDWIRFARGRHCGSWVGEAARLPGVAKVITLGVCSPDIGRGRARQGDVALLGSGQLELYAWQAPDGAAEVVLDDRAWPTISGLGEAAFLDLLDRRVETRQVYVTLDKDVLAHDEAVSNWDQGQASLAFVIAALRRVASGRQVIGADVVGDWSRAVYGGTPGRAWTKRVEAYLDQPRHAPDPALARTINEAANLRLLDAFAEAAA